MIINTGQQQDSVTLELVLFRVNQYRFGVESSQVLGSGGLPDHTVSSFESILCLADDTTNSRRQSITVKGSKQEHKLSVAVPLELCVLPAASIHPLPAVVSARCKLPGLRALATTAEGLILLIDLCSLLDSD